MQLESLQLYSHQSISLSVWLLTVSLRGRVHQWDNLWHFWITLKLRIPLKLKYLHQLSKSFLLMWLFSSSQAEWSSLKSELRLTLVISVALLEQIKPLAQSMCLLNTGTNCQETAVPWYHDTIHRHTHNIKQGIVTFYLLVHENNTSRKKSITNV